jgi:hypothetical protein
MGGLPGRILDFKDSEGDWLNDLSKTWGDTCHCGSPADLIVQGETDSFGYEANPVCRACHSQPQEPMTGACEWCRSKAPSPTIGDLFLPRRQSEEKQPICLNGQIQEQLFPTRDPDEGMHGPVYYVCRTCLAKQRERLRREAEYWEDYDYRLGREDY